VQKIWGDNWRKKLLLYEWVDRGIEVQIRQAVEVAERIPRSFRKKKAIRASGNREKKEERVATVDPKEKVIVTREGKWCENGCRFPEASVLACAQQRRRGN